MKRLAVLRFDAEIDHGRDLLAGMPRTWIPRFISVNHAEGFSTLSVLRELRSGAVVAMHGDRVVDDRSATVAFFGRPMRVPVGPYMLAALAGVPIVIVGCFKEGPDTYRTIALPPRWYRLDRSRPPSPPGPPPPRPRTPRTTAPAKRKKGPAAAHH